MRDRIKRLLSNRLTWVALASLLTAAGVNLPPQVLDALPVIGALLAQ